MAGSNGSTCAPIAAAIMAVLVAGLTWSAPLSAQQGWPPLVYGECAEDQVQVMILGTFHFAQQDAIDVLSPERQAELESVVAALEPFGATRVAVEHPYTSNDRLQAAYARYLEVEGETNNPNEIVQLGFRLGRRLGHERVYAVDEPMNLWHDSIRVFDEVYRGSRERLRRAWPARYRSSSDEDSSASLAALLAEANRDDPPANSEMYANFLPLVEGDVYAGALKLRPWYDRNLRMVQNIFRIAEGPEDRIVFVVGAGHVRVLTQMLDLTPQLCAVDVTPYLD